MVSSIARSKSTLLVVTALLGGCFAPEHGANDLEPGQEPGSLFGADASTGSGSGGCTTSTLSSLHIRVRTTAYGGRYAPRNIGAIWVEDATSGKFVHTIELWAKTRARYLSRWQTSSKGNVVDAITSATLQSHTTHDRTWNLMGADKCPMASGNYRIVLETTDYNGAGATTEIPFTKGSSAVTLTPAETTQFHDLLVELK